MNDEEIKELYFYKRDISGTDFRKCLKLAREDERKLCLREFEQQLKSKRKVRGGK